jgi:hypothetical protein
MGAKHSKRKPLVSQYGPVFTLCPYDWGCSEANHARDRLVGKTSALDMDPVADGHDSLFFFQKKVTEAFIDEPKTMRSKVKLV